MEDLVCHDADNSGNSDDEDDTDDDSAESLLTDMTHKHDENICLGYGPHVKFSRGHDIYALQRI